MTEETIPVDEEEDVVKEMFDATYPRVDVVSGPASGMRFVVLKAGQQQDPAAIGNIRAASGAQKEAPVTKAAKQTAEALATAPVESEELQIVAKEETPAEALEVVAKAEDLDVTEVLADPDKGDPTEAPEEPGSAGWEAVDAATARKWTAILSRAKNALSVLSDRENLEVAVGESDDDGSAFSLEEACCAVDYAISILAPFAVDEQSEVDSAVMETVSKAMSTDISADLDTLEGLAPVSKAGRVLSSANEQAIQAAVTSLQNVLASLPPAPAEAVAKSKEQTTMTDLEPEAEPVAKAKGDPMVACYDAGGHLLGAVNAADLTPLSAGTPVDDGADKAEEPPAPEATEAPAEGSAVPAEEPVVKSEDDAEPQDQLAEVVKAAVAEAITAVNEKHQRVLKSLEDRLETVEGQPAPGGPLLSGLTQGGLIQTSGGHLALRGQGNTDEDPEITRVRKALEETSDPVQQAQLRRELSIMDARARYGGGR